MSLYSDGLPHLGSSLSPVQCPWDKPCLRSRSRTEWCLVGLETFLLGEWDFSREGPQTFSGTRDSGLLGTPEVVPKVESDVQMGSRVRGPGPE